MLLLMSVPTAILLRNAFVGATEGGEGGLAGVLHKRAGRRQLRDTSGECVGSWGLYAWHDVLWRTGE